LDPTDDLTRDWAKQFPDLDLSSLAPLTRLARLGVLIEAFQQDVLAGFELTPNDYGVLAALRNAGRPPSLSPSQLYGRLRRSSGGMTKILKRLEASGCIERTPDPEDGRGMRVLLTARGQAVYERVFHAFVAASHHVLAPLSEAQKDEIDHALMQLLEALEGGGREVRDRDSVAIESSR
jgi:DNA-binding MarR family transcriptional regulator